MKIEDERLLIEKIELRLSNRKNSIIGDEVGRKFMKLIYWGLVLFLVVNVFFIIDDFINHPIDEILILQSLFFILAMIFMIRFVYYSSLKFPENNIERAEWIWRVGRKLYLSKTIYPIFLILVFLVRIIVDETTPNSFLRYSFYVLFCTIGYSLSIFLVTIYPKLALSRLLTGIGSTLFLCETLLIIVFIGYITDFLQFDLSIYWFLIGIVLITFVVLFITHLFNLVRKDKLNIVQIHALKIIKPVHLIYSLGQGKDRISNRINALKFIQRKLDRKEYEFLQALGEELVLEKNKISKWWYGLLVLSGLIGFIVKSLGEGLIQDLAKDQIKDWLCENIGILC